MHQKTIFSLLLMNAYLVPDVFGFPNGSVAISCDSMMPGHTGYVAQTSVPPFSVTTSKSTYAPGDQITVTLETKTSVFEGFLLQARKIDGNSAVGSFISIGLGQCQGLRCNNVANSSLSQTSASPKTRLQAVWKAPSNNTLGDIEFSATFVKDFETFWVKVKSPTVKSSATTLSLNSLLQHSILILLTMSLSLSCRK